MRYLKTYEEISLPKKRWVDMKMDDIDNETIEFMYSSYISEYRKLGMDLSVNNIEEFKTEYKTLLLIDIDKDPNPDAFILYTESIYGQKINLLWTDGKKESKRFIVSKLLNILKETGWWIEASLKIEDILKESGIPWIESKDSISKLINKDFVYLTDGYYSRKLSLYNKWITKRIYGNPVF